MDEFRLKPFIRAEYKRHKIKVELVIEYNSLEPPIDLWGRPMDLPEGSIKRETRARAIDLTINPDFMSQTRDGYSVRVIDVMLESVTDLDEQTKITTLAFENNKNLQE